MISHETAVDWWYQALAAPIGLEIPTDNQKYLTQVLYMARQALKDPKLDEISITQAKGAVWLIKKNSAKLLSTSTPQT